MENIFTASKPFLIFSKLLGFFPMSFEENSKQIIKKVKWADIFLTCCSFFILIIFNIATMLETNSLTVTNSSFLLVAWDMVRKAELVSYCFLFVYQLRRRNQIVQFLEKLHNFDEKVKKLLKFRNHKSIYLIPGKTFLHFCISQELQKLRNMQDNFHNFRDNFDGIVYASGLWTFKGTRFNYFEYYLLLFCPYCSSFLWSSVHFRKFCNSEEI